MRLEDYKTKEFTEFSGLYDRGDEENCPEGYFTDCLNVDFEIGECKTRKDIVSSIVLGYASGKVRRFRSFNTSKGVITLILDEAGNIYTYSTRTGDSATTPRLTQSSPLATDFDAIQMLGHIYIGFSDGNNGLLGVNLKIFIPGTIPGTDEFRDAAGHAPLLSETGGGSGLGFADAGAGVNKMLGGEYYIAISYITTSGYISPPGLLDPTYFIASSTGVSQDTKKTISNIPIGPTGTAKRQILITKVGHPDWTPTSSPAGFNGGMAGFYFLASPFGGLINDNTTTTATIDFNSVTDLIDSADYLFDQLPLIPAPVGFNNFGGRLAVYGMKSDPNIIQFSTIGQPEAIDGVDSIVIVNKDDGFELRNSLVMRNIFYACTQLGIYAIVDNDDIPATWRPLPIDRSTNTPSHGIAVFTSGVKFAGTWTLLVDHSGILLLDGSVHKPAITDNINDLWQRINKDYYHKIVLAIDEHKQKLYCSIPIDSATENNVLLVGDYNKCQGKIPNYKQIRWSIWTPKPNGSVRGITDLGLLILTGSTNAILRLGSISGGGKIWMLSDTSTGQDEGTDFESFFTTSLLAWVTGYIHTFNATHIRMVGAGQLLSTISGVDEILTGSLPNYNLSTAPGRDKILRFSFENERAKLKFQMVSGKFTISYLKVYGNPKYQMRPE